MTYLPRLYPRTILGQRLTIPALVGGNGANKEFAEAKEEKREAVEAVFIASFTHSLRVVEGLSKLPSWLQQPSNLPALLTPATIDTSLLCKPFQSNFVQFL